MGGLLDKANAAKEPETEAAAPETVAVKAAAAAPANDAGLLAKSGSPAGSPDLATKISLAGWVTILLGAILSLQGGAWGLAVVVVVLKVEAAPLVVVLAVVLLGVVLVIVVDLTSISSILIAVVVVDVFVELDAVVSKLTAVAEGVVVGNVVVD